MNIVLIGPPGSGKSTIGKCIAKMANLTYISSGDIARSLAERHDQTREALDNGQMAPEQLMRETLSNMIYHCTRTSGGIVLDGCPRSVDQYEWLKRQMNVDMYVIIWADSIVCRRRLSMRMRADDSDMVINARMEHYVETIIPMIRVMQTDEDTVGKIFHISNNYDNVDGVVDHPMTIAQRILRIGGVKV